VYSGLTRDSGGIQNRLGSLAFMTLYLGVMGLSSLPIWRAERLLFIRWAADCHLVGASAMTDSLVGFLLRWCDKGVVPVYC
jgi:hypothetical protein